MVEKRFVSTYCVSCGNETPVIFDITDLNHELIYSIPLCRKCSNVFAEDVISKLKTKLEHSHDIIGSKRGEIIQLKRKVKQMNIVSHNHKETITKMKKTNESD